MATIGFIGLGNMGGPMAENLLKAGHQLRVFDLVPASVDKAVAAGASAADTIAEAVTGAEVVVTMLPAGPHVRSVLQGGGALANADFGTLFIECSTIDVDTARAMHAAAVEAGMEMVDAPVSGGTAGAVAATLTFMVGGTEAAYERASSICEKMGKAVIHAGGAGNGQAAKICNNMILGVTMIGVCEALVLAEKLGLDHQKLFDISSQSSGSCWSLASECSRATTGPGSADEMRASLPTIPICRSISM